jgi:hypothetical protein
MVSVVFPHTSFVLVGKAESLTARLDTGEFSFGRWFLGVLCCVVKRGRSGSNPVDDNYSFELSCNLCRQKTLNQDGNVHLSPVPLLVSPLDFSADGQTFVIRSGSSVPLLFPVNHPSNHIVFNIRPVTNSRDLPGDLEYIIHAILVKVSDAV